MKVLLVKFIHWLNLGRARVWMGRLQQYFNVMNFFMLVYLTLQGNIQLWMIPLGVVAAGCLLWFDVKYIYPQEQKYGFQKTPPYVKMAEDMAQVRSDIKEIKEAVNHRQNTG